MYKTIAKIDGMQCSMCESHINEVIRKNFKIKKVSSSHKKGFAEIVSEEPLDESMLRKAVADTGYEVTDVKSEETAEKKKGLFGWK